MTWAMAYFLTVPLWVIASEVARTPGSGLLYSLLAVFFWALAVVLHILEQFGP